MGNRGTACLLLLPLLAACSGGSGEQDDPTLVAPVTSAAVTDEPDFTSGQNAPDPCSLLTVAEVSAAVGAAVQPGTRSEDRPPLGGESCLWAGARTFRLTLTDGGDISTPGLDVAGLYDRSVRAVPGLVETKGLGERAAIGPSQALVLKNDILLTASTDVETGAALRTLVAKAARGL